MCHRLPAVACQWQAQGREDAVSQWEMHTQLKCLSFLEDLGVQLATTGGRGLGVSYLSASLARIYDIVLVQRGLWVGSWRLHAASESYVRAWQASWQAHNGWLPCNAADDAARRSGPPRYERNAERSGLACGEQRRQWADAVKLIFNVQPARRPQRQEHKQQQQRQEQKALVAEGRRKEFAWCCAV